MSQPRKSRPARWLLPAILVLFLILGTLYALYTPDWQAPDEPAHYNYVKYLGEQHRFPVLKPGDYPASYLEEIKTAHFPPEMSIAPIRYEFHQPPLYYLLATPIYQLFEHGAAGNSLLPLRLLSVVLGALLLLVVHWTVQALAPDRPGLALGATAFVAFLPMHIAMSAAVNNDTLAELILATVLLLAVRYVKLEPAKTGGRADARLLVLLGISTGLALVTKSSIYITLPLILLAIAVKVWWLEDGTFWRGIKAGVLYLLPALALALPWWLRNLAVYGGTDFLGLTRHNQVVAGQLTTAEFVARNGLGQLFHDFVLTTFRSFWGQFGWMGVLLDQRIYQALAILSALAVVGFGLWAVRTWRDRASYGRRPWVAGLLLLVSAGLTLASYVWYNTQFLQHQGRYLFTALVPISLAIALGWGEMLRRRRALLLAALLLGAAATLKLAGLLPNWPLLMMIAAALALAIRRFLPAKLNSAIQAMPYLFLIPLALACLFLFIVPQLTL